MTGIDTCEPQIIRALEKENWVIQDKPLVLRTGEHTALADFQAQRTLNGTGEQIVVIEAKCFTDPRKDLAEFYTAIGQYIFYREALIKNQSPLPLYLAMPDTAYKRLMNDSVMQTIIQQVSMKLLIVDIETEEIVQWIT